jgi:hypothetical protein
MNCVFAAQKSNVVIDVCMVGGQGKPGDDQDLNLY